MLREFIDEHIDLGSKRFEHTHKVRYGWANEHTGTHPHPHPPSHPHTHTTYLY